MIRCPSCGHEFEPEKLKCTRCKHEWYPKVPDKLPEVCPRCKSPYWRLERTRKKKAESTGKDGEGDQYEKGRDQ